MWSSARASSSRISPLIACRAAAERSRVYIARSVATWSLRERAVWSLPATGPASSVSRRSIAMWMSSSSSRNVKRPSSSSDETASSPRRSASRSSAERIARSASMRTWARDWAMSCGHRRRSKPIEEFSRRKSGCCCSRKRDMGDQSRAAPPPRAVASAALCPRRGLEPQCCAQLHGHAGDLTVAHLREERQCQRARGDVLAHRELPLAMAETLAVEAHQVDRRKVGLALDTRGGEQPHRLVAVHVRGQLDHEHEPAANVSLAVGARQLQALDVGERLAVALSHAGAGGEHLLEVLQLGDPERAG